MSLRRLNNLYHTVHKEEGVVLVNCTCISDLRFLLQEYNGSNPTHAYIFLCEGIVRCFQVSYSFVTWMGGNMKGIQNFGV
jgi:hypothetical protein